MKQTASKALLFCFCACAATCASGADKKAAVEMEKYICDGSFFTAMVPKGWPRNEEISAGRQAREFGVNLKGPRSKDGAYLRISITYYAPDHQRFKTIEKYLRLNSKPDPALPVPGEKYGPVTALLVARRQAKQFELMTFEFIPPYAVHSVKVPVYEKRVVVPGQKAGFFVLTYHSPVEIARGNLIFFEALLAGFKPEK